MKSQNNQKKWKKIKKLLKTKLVIQKNKFYLKQNKNKNEKKA